MTDTLKLARQSEASPYVNRHYPGMTYFTFSPEKLQRFADLIREDYRTELLGASVEPVGWVRTAKEGPGVYDPMFLLGESVPTGYVSGYIPVYTAESIAAQRRN